MQYLILIKGIFQVAIANTFCLTSPGSLLPRFLDGCTSGRKFMGSFSSCFGNVLGLDFMRLDGVKTNLELPEM